MDPDPTSQLYIPPSVDRRDVGAVRQLGPSDPVGPVSAAFTPVVGGSALGGHAPVARDAAQRAADRGGDPNPSAAALVHQFGDAVHRVHVVRGETNVVVAGQRLLEIVRWLHDDAVAAVRVSVRRDGRGVPRSRAADRSRLAPALHRLSPLSPPQGGAGPGHAARGAQRVRASTRAPIGWSASASTCSASDSPATPIFAAF